MISIIKRIHSIFPRNIFYKILFLYFCLIVLTLFEFIGIGSIPILISMMIEQKADINIFGFNLIDYLDKISLFENGIVAMGFIIISIFIVKAIFLLFFNIFELSLRKKMKLIISKKLITSYLKKPFIFFINNNTSKLSKNVITEVDQSITFVTSLINISREASIVTALFLVMLYFEPFLAVYVFAFITILVGIFLYSTDSKLKKIAKKRWNIYGEFFKSVGNIFGGIKDIKIFNKQSLFIEKFLVSKKNYEDTMQTSEFIRRLPKIILEVFAIFFLIGLTIIFIRLNINTLDLIPILSLIAVTVIRFIPSFNTIAAEITYIKVYKLAFQNVSNEILYSSDDIEDIKKRYSVKNNVNAVEVDDISYSYVNEEKKISSLKNLSINIKNKSITGIIGKSGAGKSTLINIILGLLKPQSGTVNIQSTNKRSLQNSQVISYVPQDIFLTDDTLKNNIAFGFKDDEIDKEKIILCLKDAGLSKLVDSHIKGIEMPVGEKGIKLSGGERQRLGIARALYIQPEILILDEATSSLDNETERDVMTTIKALKKKCTVIIIAHRLSTITGCDSVYLLENGSVKDHGKLDELLIKYKNLN